MAATKWHIGLDGCLTIEEPATGVTYHSSLNTIIVSTKTHALKVYDVTSGSLLQKSNLSASKSNTIRCFYLGEKDQMVFCDETSVGVRKDLNGVLLLDTALQTAVSRTEDIVKVELPLAEASQLFKSLVAAELPGIDYVEDVLKELEKRIEAVQEATKSNHKIAKWAAVCLQLPNCALKTVCNNLVLEMKRLNHHSPGLSIAAAISDRLSYLLPSSLPDVTNGPVERSLMYSEAARRETFGKWPHMNYKWALPDPMAQAGFYHQPNSAGDDRAMCFTCNVCLVCWEPTDEPWSEHERHSPSCPFVKGEYTQNVPLTVTYATQPAQLHGEPTDKKNCQFNLDPSEMVITTKTGLQFEMDTTSQEQSNSESKPDSLPWQNEAGSKKDLMHELVPENSNSDFMTAKTPDIQDIPLDDEQLNKDLKAWKRTRPSQDVTVYSLCVVEKPECVLTSQKQGSQPVVQKPASQPTLLCGVSLRKTLPSCKVLNKLHHMNHNVKADVQLMNKVNEVVSNDSHPKIISDHVDSNDVDVLDRLVFIPFIIVVALQQEKAQKIKINNSNPKPSTSGNEMSVPTLGSIAMTHDWGVLDPMFESVADPEIQLASITGIGTKSTIQNNGNVVDFKISESSSSLSEVGEALSKSQSVDSLLKRTKPTPPNGHVLQCVELAKNLQVESLKISSITPILDGHFLVVILSPTSICDILKSTSEDDKRPGIPAANESAVQSSLDDSMPEGGSILVYKLSFENEHARVEEKVVVSVSVPLITESVMSVTALPTEFLGYKDEEEELCAVNNNRQQRAAELHGQIATTLYNGHIKVWNLADLTVVAEIIPEDGDYFTSLTCCTGLDRLCACTMSGKLHFYQLSEQNPEAMDVTNTGPPGDTSMDHDTLDGISTEDGMDQRNKLITGEESLFSEPLTTEKLLLLHSLTEFENLMPRYTATVPPCWTEIQQEQQQRRHPQHLQQQGEATQHTRTWKLQPDSNTWDEHLFEMVLPRPCSVGHIDVKFTLLNMCTSLPNIEVTLLKQNISNIGKQSVNAGAPGTQEKSASTPVDQKLDFNLHKKKVFPDTLDFSLLKQEENNVLDPLFLETHNAEILCGPISIASCLDLSGNNGLVSMTSPQLLNSKSKSFLLHIKGFPSKFDDSHEKPQPQELKKKSTVSAAATNSSSVSDKQKVKSIKSLFDNLPYSGMGAADRILATPKLKPENIQGCDWIQEISVTVRKTKKTSVPKERWHRNVMIESTDFHEKLLSAVTDLNESSTSTSRDHHQNLSLDILCWITAVQMTDPTHRTNERSIVSTIQKNLHKFVKVCFMQSTRTTAHKGARLLALCMEYCKISPDPDIAPSFSYNLLQSLLNCLPLLVSSYSAGALRWFFTLLSRVKCMDAHAVAEKCIYLLTTVAKTYHERETHHHSLLKSRYGLQGHPFDPDLFDLYPAQSLRQTGSSLTYASVVTNSSIGTAILAQQDEMDFYDLFNHLSEKNSEKFPSEYLRHNILGLLEVEPLHFTCHATSDGTKMERLDSGPTGNIPIVGTSGLSGTINFGESLSNAAVTGAAMAALPSSLAMAEQQVQQLASKVQQSKKDVESIKQLLSTVLKTVKPATTNSAEYGFKAPANPKTTPLFMTPPLTPPNENWSQAVTPYLSAALPNESGPLYVKVPSSVTGEKGQSSSSEKSDNKQKMSMVLPQAYHLLQPPSPQVLVVERMHSGARRFVILDFGKPILLTDVIIPACGDLASLSIDVWVQSEEVDGQRLVVASDIGVRSLIMNNIMSPPICRYLKLTTIGRYGGSTTRSKIPVGSFYGHNFIFPWEWNHYMENYEGASTSSAFNQLGAPDQPQLISQLGLFLSMSEDIQCRYSLAQTQLDALLSSLTASQSAGDHTRYYLQKQQKKCDEDEKIIRIYNDCLQLQLQLNLVQRAIDRLQRGLGLCMPEKSTSEVFQVEAHLKKTSTDKLRFLLECLLETLISMTNSSPSIPQLPVSMYTSLSSQTCELLFQHLCISGTRRIQILAGVLLVRVCGTQPWWGEFLGNILLNFFHSEHTKVFPQDRVFVLLTALGQKSLMGPMAVNILESLLALLMKTVSPLMPLQPGYVDLTLIGWILLFLCRNLDNTSSNNGFNDDTDKGAKKEKDTGPYLPNRWSFLQGDNTGQPTRSKGKQSMKSYRRCLQKRLFHHKQKLQDLEQAKKKFFASQIDKSSQGIATEAQALIKQQEQQFKKELSQYASKHLKDIMQIRRTDGEFLRKLPRDDVSVTTKDSGDLDPDSSLILPRERCLPVVQGIVTLILSMDSTCSVDLFLVACKVLAKICLATRPAISLSEAMTQDQLQQLILLATNQDFNHGNISWGGPWAGHAITCLLQDLLDGERLYPASSSFEGVTDDEMSAAMSETIDSLSGTMPIPSFDAVSESNDLVHESESSQGKENLAKSTLVMDLLLDDNEYDEETTAKFHEYISGVSIKDPAGLVDCEEGPIQVVCVQSVDGIDVPEINTLTSSLHPDEKKQKLKQWKSKVVDYGKAVVGPQGLSTALDVRLELGLQMQAELRLRVMLSLQTEAVQSSFNARLPISPPIVHSLKLSQSLEDELTDSSFQANLNQVTSAEMLQQCYDCLTNQLISQQVNLDTLLQLWLTLNEDNNHDESNPVSFDPSKSPLISLSSVSVNTLLLALSYIPNVPIRTWVLVFQTLTLLCNQKMLHCTTTGDRPMATVILSNSNFMNVLIRFLSGATNSGPAASSLRYPQVGPSATKAFYEFLQRLQVKSPDDSLQTLKEMMLKLVYMLTADRGAFYSCLGPLDAQCRFMDFVLDLTYENVDVSNAISVVESISALVYQHILCEERVVCRKAGDDAVNPRSCFGGLFASLLRGVDANSNTGDASRDSFMCSLMKLVNILVKIRVPSRYARHQNQSAGIPFAQRSPPFSAPVSDLTKLSHVQTSTSVRCMSRSDDEKGQQTDEEKTGRQSQTPEESGTYLADIIVGYQQIMLNLIHTLSYCSSSPMASLVCSGTNATSSDLYDTFGMGDPLSVGDGVYQILLTLTKKCSDIKLVLESLFVYLSGGNRQFLRCGNICRLSDPLLWLILKVLNSGQAVNAFVEMGAVRVICNNLVCSSQKIVNTSPSLISTMMQNLNSSKASGAQRFSSSDNSDFLQNFAPHGTITSGSPTASPAEVLIQSSPPHRRARSAAWSYHFYPDEAWVDLTIQLPFAILLKEVQISPHSTSLSTCPTYVSLEVSHDGVTVTPMCAPLMTCSLGFIRLQLVKPEVVTLVTIRLHRARDSMTIGLSQILLMGHSAFSDTHQKSTSVLLPPEDVVSKTSLGWVQLLQHCLTVLDSVAMAAASIPNLLTTCTALLVSPQAQTHCSHLETVLLRLGLYTTGMGLTLIDNILRNTAYLTEQDAGVLYMGKVSGVANESTIEILYQLGTVQDAGTAARVQALTQWLGDSARVALQKTVVPTSGEVSHSGAHNSSFYTLPNPAAAHVHCIAAILWQSQDLPVQHKLKTIITKDLLSSIYEWSTVLQHDSLLKRAVDCVLCAMCYIHPAYFTLILEWMGILTNVVNMTASISDDRKDGTHYRQQTSLTDDSKKANHAQFGVLTQTMFDCDIAAITLQEFGHMMLEHSHLSTLAITCRSPDAIQQLLDSRFPSLLAQGLFEFCNREISRFAESLTNPESLTDASKSQNEPGTSTEQSSQRDSIESHHSDKGLSVNADLVAAVLGFFAEISQEPLVKDWLGGPEGSIFWPVLLSLLCTIPVQTPSTNGSLHSKHKVMSGEERAAIETAVITFFTQVISCHSQNQHLFARVLCEVIREQGASKPGPIASGPPLSGFTRRLFLQVLLEEPKILVAFKTSSHHSRLEVQGCFNQIQHPRFGAGRHYYTVTVGLQATCQELINRMSDHTGHTAQFWDGSDEKKRSDDSKKEAADMGMKIEVVDFLSNAAGLLAKERREKSPSSSKSVAPRLPPRIKGRQSSDTVTVNLQFPVLSLYHLLLSGQALPADLTLSQLLVILQERGHPQGQAVMELLLKFHASKSPESKIDQDRTLKAAWFGQEDICAEDLLSTVSFPSALQVFASVGGLALLAEHLPVLYSEVSRQPAVPDTMNTAATEISQDQWVSVDSSDLNETFYEPVQQAPTLPSQSGGGTIHSGLPTIPPHSLIAFGLFLRLPGYAEVLLKERKKAQCLLRLVLGVTDDGDGGHILTSPIANSLPTLPFNVMKALFDATPLTTDDGVLLRRMTLDIGALHLILACLSVLSHHAPRAGPQGIQQETQTMLAAMQANNQSLSTHPSEEKSQQYWAKGTGFGTGSTTSSWDADQALLRQKSEEEHVTCLLQVISSYINPGGVVPTEFDPSANNFSYHNLLPEVMPELLRQSCLVPAISSYLRNDSVLDMARHIPLYKSLLELLRGLAICPVLVPLLLPLDKVNDSDSSTSVGTLLEKMRGCVDTYANRLKSNKGNKTSSTSTTREEEEENEGLALLIPDIQETARIVQIATDWLKGSQIGELNAKDGSLLDKRDAFINKSLDEKYMSVMKSLQFDTFVMVSENEGYLKFSVSHHYESNVRASGCVSNPSRARRLAQEAVTLSTSLPLSASSSVFVRCDEDRLDIMKVLITGPADTPYANGCFEFDVYFPQDYPNSPPFINLETTGNHSIRFNPNLYNDGKVCLSVLNTWHGRPEEKWNSQTSSFLQVLVSIQSLILVSEPYFNEPGYERSRGTPSGTASSREYDANIRQATVKWAMLEQIKDPSPCFKEVIQNHFWMKRHEVLQQCGQWITEMESYSSDKRTGRHIAHSTLALKRHYNQLREEFSKMKPPAGMEDEEVNIPEETKEFPNSKSFSELEAEDTLVQGESNNTDITDPITALESLPFGPNSIDC